MSLTEVHSEFYPKKLYRCPCLIYLIGQIYDAGNRNFSQILSAITNC